MVALRTALTLGLLASTGWAQYNYNEHQDQPEHLELKHPEYLEHGTEHVWSSVS